MLEHLQIASTMDDLLEEIRHLSKLLGIPAEEPFREVLGFLRERRDLLAICEPTWRRKNRDKWFEKLCLYYDSENLARIAMKRIEDLEARLGDRADDKASQQKWKDAQFRDAQAIPCVFCGVACRRDNCTLEHWTACSRGGTDAPSNWAVSCMPCNDGKSDLEVGRAIRAWRSRGLLKHLMINGKQTISTGERFDVLTRAEFNCSRNGCETKPINVYLRCSVSDGGSAILGNLFVSCEAHSGKSKICEITKGESNVAFE